MVSPAFPGLFFAFAAAVLLLFGEFCFGPSMRCEIISGASWKYSKATDSRCFWKIISKRGLP